MKFHAFVAGRYLKAKRKQAFIGVISLITLAGITLGVASLNVALSIHNGMRMAFIVSLVGETGTLHVVSNTYDKKGFDEAELTAVVNVLKRIPSTKAFALTRQEPGVVLSQGRRLQYLNLNGILPDEYRLAANTLNRLESGNLDDLKPRDGAPFPIILGHDLARHLGARKGSMIRVAVPRLSSPGLTSTRGINMKQMKCEVVGIFKTGNSQFDERDAYLHLDALFKLLNTTRVQTVLATFNSIDDLDAAKQVLIMDPEMPPFATVVDLRELNVGLLNALKLEKLATTTVISLFILIVALNMISALTMLVMEKHRDIGIMKSFGTPRKMILAIFIRQGMTLAIWGTILGTILGVGLAFLGDHFQLIKLDNSVYEVLSYLPFKVNWVEVVMVAAGSLVISLLTTIFPAKQAADLNPVEALKYD